MEESDNILKQFLQLNFYYKIKYNKNKKDYDVFITIPKGRKYYIWIKDNEKYYYFFEHDTFNNIIKKGKHIETLKINNFGSNDGTLLFGTLFEYKNTKFYNIEDIFYYNDEYVYNKTYIKKLLLFEKVLNNINNDKICFGLPIIDKNKKNLLKNIKNIPYNLYCIQHKYLFKKNKSIYNEKIEKNKKFLTFLIKATNKADNYMLYYKSNNKLLEYDTAMIGGIKTSYFMNNIFRNIKENENLDLIEESDDEDNFQNIDNNKYLKDKNNIKFNCIYNSNFNNWTPISISKNKICNKKDIDKIINNLNT